MLASSTNLFKKEPFLILLRRMLIKQKHLENYVGAFTLIELLIAVSILAVGIVFVFRSFLCSVTALDTSLNRISAVQILEEKMVQIEEQMKNINDGKCPRLEESEVVVGSRSGEVSMEVKPLVLEEDSKEIEEEEVKDKEEPEQIINEIELVLRWQEQNKDRDLSVGTYFILNVTK